MSKTEQPNTATLMFESTMAPQLAQIKDSINSLFNSFIEEHLSADLPRFDEFITKVTQLRDSANEHFQDGYDQGLEMIRNQTDLEAERFTYTVEKEFSKKFEIEKKNLIEILAKLERKIDLIRILKSSNDETAVVH